MVVNLKKVVRVATPAAIAVLRQATAIAPKRKKASDGLLPSAAHIKQNPNSDHNTGLAADLTHDPHNGFDGRELFQKLRDDKRVDYLIFNSRIWSARNGERDYTGSNRHEKHIHISIKKEHSKDTSPWFGWMEKPKLKNRVKSRFSKKATKTAVPSPKGD
jgi:hypothetical protein